MLLSFTWTMSLKLKKITDDQIVAKLHKAHDATSYSLSAPSTTQCPSYKTASRKLNCLVEGPTDRRPSLQWNKTVHKLPCSIFPFPRLAKPERDPLFRNNVTAAGDKDGNGLCKQLMPPETTIVLPGEQISGCHRVKHRNPLCPSPPSTFFRNS